MGVIDCHHYNSETAVGGYIITEKEMAIFELRKVLFPEKHLRELLGACSMPILETDILQVVS